MKDKKFTPEEITESLRVCAGTDCKGCVHPGCGEELCMNALNKIAADMLEELAAEVARLREEQRWIPVEERKPDEEYAAALAQGDEDVEVIAMIQGGDVATALRYDGDIRVFFAVDDGEFIPYRVTHWKPMPRGPEVGHDDQ